MFVEFFNEYENLIEYANNQLKLISYTYNLTLGVYYYNKLRGWQVNIGKKYKQCDVLKIELKEKDNFKKEGSGKNNSEGSCSYL